MPNRYASSDVPGYENYPSPSATDFGRPDFNAEAVSDETSTASFRGERALPEGRLNEVARNIGTNLGRIVTATREHASSAQTAAGDGMSSARETFDSKVKPMIDNAQTQARDIFETRVRPAVDNMTTQARETFDRTQQQMRTQIDATQRRVRETLDRTQVQVKQTVDQHPLETILAAGVAGLVIGMGLRFWRDNRAS